MVKISIIVPVYGVEKYLHRCVDSLVNQTLQEIEIILVNDCSPDRCSEIMREYEEKYPDKIRCIYLKENLKQGGARNAGLKVATGEYIHFIDSDDWVDPTMCEKMYLGSQNASVDIIFCDYCVVNENTGETQYKMQVIDEVEGNLTDEKMKMLFLTTAYPFEKMVKRSIIMDHQLFFPEKILYEDVAVVLFSSLYSKTAAKVNEPLYYYNKREASTTGVRNAEYHLDLLSTMLLFYEEAKKRGFYDAFREEVNMYFVKNYYFHAMSKIFANFDEIPIDKLYEMRNTIKELCPDYRDNIYLKKVQVSPQFDMAVQNDQSPEDLVKRKKEGDFKISYLQFYQEEKEKAQQFLQKCEEKDYKIAVWGASVRGKDFLAVNDPNHEKIPFIIDNNPKKQGTMLPTGHRVYQCEEVISDVDVIIVLSRGSYGDIYYRVREKNKKVKIIHFDFYLIFDAYRAFMQ